MTPPVAPLTPSTGRTADRVPRALPGPARRAVARTADDLADASTRLRRLVAGVRPGAVARRAAAPVAAGLLAAAVTVVGLAWRIGLWTLPGLGGGLIGAGDNGDAYRLFCTAGLTPDTPSGFSLWRGVVVTEFTTGSRPCTAAPSSAATLLRLVAPDGPGTFSLTTYAWLFAGLTALGVGLAAAALASVRPWRALLMAVPLLPLLAVTWWSRFLVSLYAEPTALVATLWLVAGLLVVAGTRPTDRWQRLLALALIAAGGFVGATAKPGFVPIGLVAAGCAVLVAVRSPHRDARDDPRRGLRRLGPRVAGPLVAVALLGAAAGPVSESIQGQESSYAAVNAHNLIFTALMPEVGPETVAAAVGLPPGATAHSGEGFYWAFGMGIPGWATAIGDRPDAARADARGVLLEHPGALAAMVGDGLTATMRPELSYLPSAPRGTAPERFEGRTVYPEAGPQTALLQRWLAGIGAGRLPAAVVLAALAAAASTLLPAVRRRGDHLTVRLVRVAGASAVLALGIVTLAVLGDGFYELSKHVWLASYLVATTALTGASAVVVGTTARFRRPR